MVRWLFCCPADGGQPGIAIIISLCDIPRCKADQAEGGVGRPGRGKWAPGAARRDKRAEPGAFRFLFWRARALRTAYSVPALWELGDRRMVSGHGKAVRAKMLKVIRLNCFGDQWLLSKSRMPGGLQSCGALS
jgi:hypothetical protein